MQERYIGRSVTRMWLNQDGHARIYTVSRKGTNELQDPSIGYVGGSLGSRAFVESKTRAAQLLKATGKKVVVVNPTLVYGDGRHDTLAKMVPLLKFLGLFSKKFKPVTVDAVARELVVGLQP